MRNRRRSFFPFFLLLLVLSLRGESLHVVNADTAPAAVSAVQVFKQLDYRYFLAGGTCAAISHGITTPIDVVKTRIQADPKKYNSMTSAAISIVKDDGPQALLGGLGPTVVGYGIEGAMKFGVYEIMKPIFSSLLPQEGKGVAFLLASIIAGAVAAMLLCPMESTRIRIVTDPAYADKGLLTGFPKLVQEEGLWSSFSGLWAMLAKQIPYTFGKQVSFDVFAGLLYEFYHSLQDQLKLTDTNVKWAVSVTAAFLASIVACIFSQPGDMILTATYRPNKVPVKSLPKRIAATVKHQPRQLEEAEPSSDSFSGIVRQIYATGGIANFFTGTQARIVHVGLIITSQLVIYDIVKQLLGLPATGSH